MKNKYAYPIRLSLILLLIFLGTARGNLWGSPTSTATNRLLHLDSPPPENFQQTLEGVVTDANEVPIFGASVMLKNTTVGTVTDQSGAFKLAATPMDTLVVSYLGYETVELPVGNKTSFTIVLTEDMTQLGEVTIDAGYYSVSERERTGNIARIGAEDIERQPVNNPLAAMQGHLAGVNITQTTGVPGGGYDIVIRGQNFISGNTQPLYIIDGVPFDGESLEDSEISRVINQGNVSPLNALDPSIIESIEVLKDADATAIYGSRGANGVVLITTKKGQPGELRVTVNANHTLGKVAHFMRLMNTEQYLAVRKEALENSGLDITNPPGILSWPDLISWSQTRYTDWQRKLIGGTSHRNNAKITLSGGSEQTRFLVGGSLMTETAVFPGSSKYKKASFFNNLNHSSKDDRFRFNLSVNYTHDNNSLPRWDLTDQAFSLPPNAPELYNEDGSLNWKENTWDNPMARLLEKYTAKSDNLLLNSTLSYEIIPDLRVKANLGYSKYQLQSDQILPSTARNPSFSFTPQSYSSITLNNSRRESWIIEPQLHWSPQFGKAKIEALVGTTFQNQTTNQLTTKGTGFPDNSLIYNIAAANTVEVRSTAYKQYKYQAVFGRINLNYDQKYILNLTGRRDGSSRFGPGKRFGNFGAVGAAWLFSEEGFLKNDNLLSFGKLRGSYGTTGSDNIGDYQYLSTYQILGTDYNGTTVMAPSGVFNPDFGWETNKKLELGLELGFFKTRLRLNTSWFRNRSSNQLIGVPLAATTGFSSLTSNFDATVQNTGWEFELNTLNLKSGDFRWTTNFNLTIPKNKLVSFPGLESSTFANRYIVGKSLTILKLYHALGVNSETGVYEFEDYNGDGKISSPDDKQWVEDFAPKFYGGLQNTLNYKGLALKFFFQFKKQRAYNFKRTTPNPGAMKNGYVGLLDRWQQPGDQTNVMRGSYSDGSVSQALSNYESSSGAVSDASYIRLRNIDLSYHLPSSFTGEDLGVTLYLQGQNLWTITGFKGPDPEQPFYTVLPPLRQFTFGVELTF